MENQDAKQIHEYAAGFIEYKPEGYFYVRMKDYSVSTVDTVKHSNEIMTNLQPEGAIFILVDAGVGSSSEDDIFDYIATSDFGKRVKAQAVIVHDLAARLMGNLFLRFIKNKRHVKIFAKPEDARSWLLDRMQDASGNGAKTKRLMFV